MEKANGMTTCLMVATGRLVSQGDGDGPGICLGDGQTEAPRVLTESPGGVLWNTDGFKYLGIHLGTTSYIQRNWDGFLDNIKQKL